MMLDNPRLAHEARVMTKYLLDCECPPEMIERYMRAVRAGSPEESRAGATASDFAFAHPWSLPFLDAAAAIISGDPVLRTKLHIMTAVLEASPVFAHEFLPRSGSRAATVMRLIAYAGTAGAKALIGLALLMAVRRRIA